MSGWKNKFLSKDDILASVREIAKFLIDVLKGEQEIPFKPAVATYNFYVGELVKRDSTSNEIVGKMWFGQLVFFTKSEEIFKELHDEIRAFLKSKGECIVKFDPKKPKEPKEH